MNQIIVLEGISGAGKTTLVKELNKRGWYIVEELSKKFDPIKDFPKFVIEKSEVLKANSWFLNAEAKRYKEAIDKSIRNKVVLDRGYYSICAVSYARNKLFGTEDSLELTKEINDLIKDNSLIEIPTFVVDAPVNICIERINIRYNKNLELMRELNLHPELMKHQREFYLNLVKDKKAYILNGVGDTCQEADKIESILRSYHQI